MSNALYTKGKQHILNGAIDFDTDTIRCFLVDSASYTLDIANHDYLDDIPVGARKGNSGSSTRGNAPQLTTPSITNGVFDAANTTFTSVTTGNTYEYIIIFRDDGVADSSSELIACIDTAASGLPVTPNGGDITVEWDDGSYKIFAL